MIRLTKLSDYGFVLMARMANPSFGSSHNARDLAVACGVPLPMTGKILKLLAKQGLLTSHRGMKGGYSIAYPPEKITVADIVAALEGPIALTECVGHSPSNCRIESCCPVRTNWERINAAVRGALENITLAELSNPWSPGRSIANGESIEDSSAWLPKTAASASELVHP